MPQPVDLLLVRHGLTTWNETGRLMGRTDVPLSPRGRTEAGAVARALRSLALRAVVASPQLRARETAARIARNHDLEVRIEPGLAEVWAAPTWEGRTWADLRAEPDILALVRDATYTSPHLEAAAAVQQRMVDTIDRVRADVGHGTLVVVSHGDPIKLLLAHHLAMDIAAYRRLLIDTGSVSVIRFSPVWGARLMVINWKPPGRLDALLAQPDPAARLPHP